MMCYERALKVLARMEYPVPAGGWARRGGPGEGRGKGSCGMCMCLPEERMHMPGRMHIEYPAPSR